MASFTIDERKKIYEDAKALFSLPESQRTLPYFSLIVESFCEYLTGKYRISIDEFSEYLAQKPKRLTKLGYWFNTKNQAQRIAALNRAIALCEQQISQPNPSNS